VINHLLPEGAIASCASTSGAWPSGGTYLYSKNESLMITSKFGFPVIT
jgi:hypothetical protein